MSYVDYTNGQALEFYTLQNDIGFYAVIQCAMRRADPVNLDKLSRAFPKVKRDLVARYDAPGGFLPEKQEVLDSLVAGN